MEPYCVEGSVHPCIDFLSVHLMNEDLLNVGKDMKKFLEYHIYVVG